MHHFLSQFQELVFFISIMFMRLSREYFMSTIVYFISKISIWFFTLALSLLRLSVHSYLRAEGEYPRKDKRGRVQTSF